MSLEFVVNLAVVARQHFGTRNQVVVLKVRAVVVLDAIHAEVAAEVVVTQQRAVRRNGIVGNDDRRGCIVGQSRPEADIAVVGDIRVDHPYAGHEAAGAGAHVAAAVVHVGAEMVATALQQAASMTGCQATVGIDGFIARLSVRIKQDAVLIVFILHETSVLGRLFGRRTRSAARSDIHGLRSQVEPVGTGHRAVSAQGDTGVHQQVLVESLVEHVGADFHLRLVHELQVRHSRADRALDLVGIIRHGVLLHKLPVSGDDGHQETLGQRAGRNHKVEYAGRCRRTGNRAARHIDGRTHRDARPGFRVLIDLQRQRLLRSVGRSGQYEGGLVGVGHIHRTGAPEGFFTQRGQAHLGNRFGGRNAHRKQAAEIPEGQLAISRSARHGRICLQAETVLAVLLNGGQVYRQGGSGQAAVHRGRIECVAGAGCPVVVCFGGEASFRGARIGRIQAERFALGGGFCSLIDGNRIACAPEHGCAVQ